MGRPKKTSRKNRRKKMKLTISDSRYKKLISLKKGKKKMTLRNRKLLDDALYVKYCKCLQEFEFKKKDKRGYPICMNSVYKNRGFKPPKNASRKCNKVFNKYISK
jgi:hypothetical protein